MASYQAFIVNYLTIWRLWRVSGDIIAFIFFWGFHFSISAPRSQVYQKSSKSSLRAFFRVLTSFSGDDFWTRKSSNENDSLQKSSLCEICNFIIGVLSPTFSYIDSRNRGQEGKPWLARLCAKKNGRWARSCLSLRLNCLVGAIVTDGLLLGSVTPADSIEFVCTSCVGVINTVNAFNGID